MPAATVNGVELAYEELARALMTFFANHEPRLSQNP
jgi:hypothetical protein